MKPFDVLSLIKNVLPGVELKIQHLVFCIIHQESGFDSNITRYEPDWIYYIDVPIFAKSLDITDPTERVHQGTSWGLMQIMGSVAREFGYKDHLVTLIAPKINIEYGFKKLNKLLKKYTDIKDAISAYNMGHPRKVNGLYINQQYVDNIYKQLEAIS